GSGGFSFPHNFKTSSFGTRITIKDVNLDGKLDLGICTQSGVDILPGTGTGGFGDPQAYPLYSTPSMAVLTDLDGDGYIDLAVGDFNRDGQPDLVTANPGSSMFNILLNDGKGGFSAAIKIMSTFSPGYVAVADMNLDKKPYVIISDEGVGKVSVYLGDGMGGF